MNNDLISREALLKATKSPCKNCKETMKSWCEHCCPVNDFLDIINNAPTVPIPVDQNVWEDGYECGKGERPQGEWKSEGGFVFCNQCGISHGVHKTNFCPNCGANMKGGAE